MTSSVSFIGLLAISQSLLENLLASAIFFVLDIVLIVTLLPMVLAARENRQWAPMRKRLAKLCYDFFNNCAYTGVKGSPAILHLYVELCRRCAAYQQSIGRIDPTLNLDVIGVPHQAFWGGKGDLYAKAKENLEFQEQVQQSLERTIDLNSPCINAPLALVISDFQEHADDFTAYVRHAVLGFERSEEILSRDHTYTGEGAPWNTLREIHLMHVGMEILYDDILTMHRILGLKLEETDRVRPIERFREAADECRKAYQVWTTLTDSRPLVDEIHNIHERKVKNTV